MNKFFALAALALLVPLQAAGQETARVKGKVFDSATGIGVAGAIVRVTSSSGAVTETATGSDGEFDIPVDAGETRREIFLPGLFMFEDAAQQDVTRRLRVGEIWNDPIPATSPGGGVVVSGPGSSNPDDDAAPSILPCDMGIGVLPIYIAGAPADLSQVTFTLQYDHRLNVGTVMTLGTLAEGAKVGLGKESGGSLRERVVTITGMDPSVQSAASGVLVRFLVSSKHSGDFTFGPKPAAGAEASSSDGSKEPASAQTGKVCFTAPPTVDPDHVFNMPSVDEHLLLLDSEGSVLGSVTASEEGLTIPATVGGRMVASIRVQKRDSLGRPMRVPLIERRRPRR